MKSIYELSNDVINNVMIKDTNENDRNVLRTLNFKDMTFADKRDAIIDILEFELGCVPKELSIGKLNQYKDFKDKISVNISFVSRQRAVEDKHGVFPIGYLLKTLCDEHIQKCQRTFRIQNLESPLV